MPAATTIFFAHISGSKTGIVPDLVMVVNVGKERSKLTAVAKSAKAQTLWSGEKELDPFEVWAPSISNVVEGGWLKIQSNGPIVGEKHCYVEKDTFDFPGAAPEYKTAGRRLFFPEVYLEGKETLRILNIGENESLTNLIVRDLKGNVLRQLSNKIPVSNWWYLDDRHFGHLTGTMEILGTQPIIAERHLYYSNASRGGVGQLGQVLD